MRFGFCAEASEPLSREYVAAMADLLGPHPIARMAINWRNESNPQRGVFSFDLEIENCKLLIEHGFQIKADRNWCPRQYSRGMPTWEQYMDGSSWYSTVETICGECGHPPGSHTSLTDDGLTTCLVCRDVPPTDEFLNDQHVHRYVAVPPRTMVYAKWRERARNPREIDAEAAYEFGVAAALALGSYVTWWGDVNEPGILFYNPMLVRGQDAAFDHLFNHVTRPFVQGVRSVRPRAVFVGVDAAGADELRRMAEWEEKSGLDIYDAFSVHYPLVSDNYLDILKLPVIRGRKAWVGEAGYEDPAKTRAEAELVLRHSDVYEALIWYQGNKVEFFRDRNGGDFTLTENGRVVQEIARKYSLQQPPAPTLSDRLLLALGQIESGMAAAKMVAIEIEERLSKPVLVEPKMLDGGE